MKNVKEILVIEINVSATFQKNTFSIGEDYADF